MFQPPCGIFQQMKYLPLRYGPLGIELELADVLDPILSDFILADAVDTIKFIAANTSILCKI